ncbi:MAG: hypothetical protein RI937_1190, partial [Pseudomonadota bacterium]
HSVRQPGRAAIALLGQIQSGAHCTRDGGIGRLRVSSYRIQPGAENDLLGD